MTVESILQTKGSDVIAIAPTATLHEAAQLLSEHRIGAVVVLDSHEALKGILSERDIVRTMAAKGAAALDMLVSAVMTSEVVTIPRSETAQSAMSRMSGRRIRHLPVVEDGKLAGMISIGDVVKRRIEEVESEASTLRTYITS